MSSAGEVSAAGTGAETSGVEAASTIGVSDAETSRIGVVSTADVAGAVRLLALARSQPLMLGVLKLLMEHLHFFRLFNLGKLDLLNLGR